MCVCVCGGGVCVCVGVRVRVESPPGPPTCGPLTPALSPRRENNCQELKKETEIKIQTLTTDHKAKVRGAKQQ